MNALFQPSVVIEPMHANDLDAILKIEYRLYDFPWSRGNFADSLTAGYSCWVCRVTDELIGYLVLMLAVDDAHLLNISVAAERQGMGFGARLLHQAMCAGRQGGAKNLLLEVRRSNTKALTLYQHFGFQKIGVRRDYYPAHKGREDALVLSHSLHEVVA